MKIKNLNKVTLFFVIPALFLFVLLNFGHLESADAQGFGKYFFRYYNCINCHTVNGIGGTLGPPLSNYGNENKSFAWTITQIKNPQAHFKTGSKIKINGKNYYALMPSYKYIPDGDVEKLASYLESLKKR